MELAVPLSRQQIAAANRLHAQLPQWTLSDSALAKLAERFPGFDAEACLLKAAAVNALYGTRVFAQVRMARHVEQVMTGTNVAAADEDLVEVIASLPSTDAQKAPRRHRSFASKFCHFFVDPDRFPIMDSYADSMLKRHLGRAMYKSDSKRPYRAFVRNFRRLGEAVGHVGTGRDLDHYLWIAGQYHEWKKRVDQGKVAKTNAELRVLFDDPCQTDAEDLDILLSSSPDKALTGEIR